MPFYQKSLCRTKPGGRLRFRPDSVIISACSRRKTTRALAILLTALAALLVHLTWEKARLARALRRVPRRVAVTGTRGKSGTVRLIAAGLRASGSRVLAKTTGSRPALIFPDGSEREVPRPGPASIREQVRLVRLAERIGADTLVAELMSIGPECLATESRGILRPQVLALTNVRLDHLEEMGRTRGAVASVLSEAFPDRGAVVLPAEEMDPAFEAAAARRGATLVPVAGGPSGTAPEALRWAFEPNVRLAAAVLGRFGLERPSALAAMAAAEPDFGSLKVIRAAFGSPSRPALCVSAFAANDPGSSAEALDLVRQRAGLAGRPQVGLLVLREDRGDRTEQWLAAAEAGFFRGFERVLVLGVPARAFVRKLRRSGGQAASAFEPAPWTGPKDLMDVVLRGARREPVVVGLGNIVGPGEEIVRHWQAQGAVHDH